MKEKRLNVNHPSFSLQGNRMQLVLQFSGLVSILNCDCDTDTDSDPDDISTGYMISPVEGT